MAKRIISFIIAVAMIATLAAGCGGEKGPAADTTTAGAPASTAEEKSTAEPKKDVTITLWQASASTYDTRLKMQEEFQKEYPHIKLNIVETPEGAAGNYIAAVAAGTAPTVSGAGWPSVAPFVYQNALLPLDDFIAKTPDFANFDQAQADMFKINGKHYAVPGGSYVMRWCYNKKLFNEAGITAPPKTWDEFLEDAKKLTIPEKQQYGVAILASVWGCWHFMNWVWGAGGDLSKMNSDGTLTLTFTDPAAIKAAEFYRTLRKEKVVQSDLSKDYGALQKDFALGKVGMFFGGSRQNVVSMGGKAEDVGYFAFPKGPSGNGYTQSGGDVDFITVTDDPDVAEAAWTYLMYAHSKEWTEADLKEKASKGALESSGIPARTDVNISDFGEFDAEEIAVVEESRKWSKPEFYGKGAVSQYADDMVATIFGDLNADITKVFQEQQDKAAKDVETFNKGLLEGK